MIPAIYFQIAWQEKKKYRKGKSKWDNILVDESKQRVFITHFKFSVVV